MREYKRGDKIVLHSTDVFNHLICPFMFNFRENDIQTNARMEKGLLVEGYALGFKPDIDVKKLEGRKNTEPMKIQAEIIKLLLPEGEPFVRLETEYKGHILTGEIDFLGDEMYDLKTTSNIENWADLDRVKLLQSVYYNFIYKLKFDKVLPFNYIVIDDNNLVSTIKVMVTEEDLDWVKEIIDDILESPFKEATYNCLNQPYGICNHLKYCPEGQLKHKRDITINFGDL